MSSQVPINVTSNLSRDFTQYMKKDRDAAAPVRRDPQESYEPQESPVSQDIKVNKYKAKLQEEREIVRQFQARLDEEREIVRQLQSKLESKPAVVTQDNTANMPQNPQKPLSWREHLRENYTGSFFLVPKKAL